MQRIIERLNRHGIFCNQYREKIPQWDGCFGYKILTVGRTKDFYLMTGGKYVAVAYGHGSESIAVAEFIRIFGKKPAKKTR